MISIFVPIVVLVVEFSFNMIRVSTKHVVLVLFVFLLYLITSAVSSFALNQSVYGSHLCFYEHKNFNWTKIMNNMSNDSWNYTMASECKNYF